MNKPRVFARPWWRHPVFPWGWIGFNDIKDGNYDFCGFYKPNDGGACSYKMVSPGAGKNDGGDYHDLANGNQATFTDD